MHVRVRQRHRSQLLAPQLWKPCPQLLSVQAVCRAPGDGLLQQAGASRRVGPCWVGRSEPLPLPPGSTRTGWLWKLSLHTSGNFLSENEREGLGFGVLYYYFYLNVFILASIGLLVWP